MDNREAILSEALHLFYVRGYDAVGAQEIVDAAGVTKPTLYYYFGSKKGLLETLLSTRCQELEEELKTAAEGGKDLPSVLYQIARGYFDFACRNREFYLFMLGLFYSGRESDGYQAVNPLIERYYQQIVGIFEKFSHQLGNMRGRQREFAVGFIGVMDHHFLMVSHSCQGEVEISDEQTRQIVNQFMYGIYS